MNARIASPLATRYEPNHGSTYTVVSGDNLHHIAQKFGLSLEALLAQNPQIHDAGLISPGQRINLPQPPRSVRVVRAPTTRPTSTVSFGDRGGQVRDLQSRLAAAGFSSGPIDGVFGPGTERAVMRFQRSVGLSQDGIAGSNTLRALYTEVYSPPGSSVSSPPRSANNTPRPPFPVMSRGSNGPQVRTLQEKLNTLGYDAGPVDGDFGAKTQYAVQRFQTSQGLTPDGIVGNQTMSALLRPSAVNGSSAAPRLPVYPPHSPEAIALFREAASLANVPTSWASSNGLHQILSRESGGRVGVPNYTYGSRAQDPSRWPQIWSELRNDRITARSSATGLGQLLLNNVEEYYPSGRNGIGNPVEEAVGMLKYIKARYGDPENAWRRYGRMGFEGY